MKKIVGLIGLLMMLIQPSFTQTVFWEEDFFDSIPGWILQNNWIHHPGLLNFNGSATPYYFDYTATSPFIELDEEADQLIINQYIEVWDFDADDGIAEIAILLGTDMHVVWSHDLADGDWGWYSGTDLILDVSEFAGMDIRILFHSFGNPQYMIYNWNIFNVSLYTTFNNDLAVTDISGPKNLENGEPGTWDFTITNFGELSQDNFSLSFIDYKGDLLPTIVQIDQLLLPGESMDFQFVLSFQIQLNTLVYAEVGLPNDDFPANNASNKLFLRVEPEFDYDILIWDNDNTVATIWDPELGDLVGAEVGIIRALTGAGIDFDLSLTLPNNFSEYDIIICTMGAWCES